MTDFNDALYKASMTCEGKLYYISEFSKIYTFTTENISGYIDYFDLDNKSLLTVGSSGDQVLNAFYNVSKYNLTPSSSFPRIIPLACFLVSSSAFATAKDILVTLNIDISL